MHQPATPHPDVEFFGRHVLVTGAASGIGRALSLRLLALGARVSALDLDTSALAGLAWDADGIGEPDALCLQSVDVGDAAAVETAIAAAEQQHGPVQYLSCVAGVLQMGRIVDLTDAQWLRVFNINTTGVFNVCRRVARSMIEQGRGAIVNVSSNAAGTPRAGMGAYAASKAAVTQMSACLALELAPHGIRVNVVSPGSTDTEMQRAMWRQGSSLDTVLQGDAAQFRLGIPLGKIATPDDIADAILFLLSKRAGHITLHDLRVDGGATLDQR
ncbi:2,3-dihydro-2,3-dihydroxybenzoate dehydrogenase [Corticimicrobacter populi]|uniref:2,3-dihydro-2,3-dihydroxybenzoate dehydrogenase n=1 Tax=Corticimicrobacter populi TaxID=2175229 RepID=A0A2V1K355_9BURK|nr:2,3-dihydro-2,3-dihydroxybenzoate dehydrogenase [Corticimicrobacter populi]PWF23773.1 2,3-dihydro-2,3-dihydroxybenzoate dehydrogenase [Corticimicrobacter populi]